ncbi:MAG: hypothetical protein K8R67_00595 [Desulfobacteraceae bacterium]|nr:hypothetical protein [Desulfobacteraceae bacterium]
MALCKLRQKIKDIGVKNIIMCFIFQWIIRINSHVPWPVHPTSIVNNPENIKHHKGRPIIGFSPCCYIQAMNGIEIGKNVRIGPGVNAIISPNVSLADHTIVATGAVVTKSFSEGNCIIGGVPEKLIK